MRKIKLITGEKYHIFNRGVDKRPIFIDTQDVERFFHSMKVFNDVELIGSLHEIGFKKDKKDRIPLVHFIAQSLEPNHFHFVLEQAVENGISKFMKRLIGGYVWYFNNKHKRIGSLLQGPFKGKHIKSNEYLLYVSAYVNLNDEQKALGDLVTKGYSSWKEYQTRDTTFCTHKYLVLDQFEFPEDYKRYAKNVLEEVKTNKERYKLLGL